MRKKKVKIINNNGFTKVVNIQRTPSLAQGPALKTLALEAKIKELED